MSTIKEAIYMVMDELKVLSDDSTFNINHIKYLLSPYRHKMLEAKYNAKNRMSISRKNFQSLDMELEPYTSESNTNKFYLKSKRELPTLSSITKPIINTGNKFDFVVSFVPYNRFKYTRENKYLANIIYATVGNDNYLYLSSTNPNFRYLESIECFGVFEDFAAATMFNADMTTTEFLDTEFPLENQLISEVTLRIVQELLGARFRPKDDVNNAKDDSSTIANYVRQNVKSDLAKQMTQ